MNWKDKLEDITRESHADQLLTADQAARLMGITPRRVYMMGLKGMLPRVFLGTKTIRYRESDIRQLIRESVR